MVPANLDPLAMLREKAMLLLRRERSLYELQRERARSEAWLAAFHRLSYDLRTTTSSALFEVCTVLLVDELGFQIAGIYGNRASELGLRLHQGRAHVALNAQFELSLADFAFLDQHPSGFFARESPAELRVLAKHMQFETFLWHWQQSSDERLLVTAGFASLPGRGHRFSQHELEHFRLFGAQFHTLLDNVTLVRYLDLERADLREANHNLDKSLKELRDAQASLVQQRAVMLEVSRRAGMADVATGVLHNVGNILNSINVSVQVTAERLSELRTKGLTRVLELLESRESKQTEDSQLERIVNYLQQLLNYLNTEKTSLVGEVMSMQLHIDHIKQIIGKQQDYAIAIGMFEPCNVVEIADDALSLALDSFNRYDIEVTRLYDTVPVAQLDRHKVLQIMVNLISNAVYAVKTSKALRREIHVRVENPTELRLRISIRDNGVGIAANHLPRLFTHGFTTKESGHGFGLHASAIAAKEIGAELRGSSPGIDQGATFILDLPLVAERGLEV